MNVLLEVHYYDREELGPLEPPVGVAVGPVVLGAHVPLSVVVHGVVHDDDLTLQSLTGPPRVVEFSQRPIN